MIVTEGFEPVEFDGPNPTDLVFIEHVDGLEGNSILALSKSGVNRGYWRINTWDPPNFILFPRNAIKGDYKDSFIYCAGRTAFVEWAIRIADPLRDDWAPKMKHYRIVTDRFFFDFIDSGLASLTLTRLPMRDPNDPWDFDD